MIDWYIVYNFILALVIYKLIILLISFLYGTIKGIYITIKARYNTPSYKDFKEYKRDREDEDSNNIMYM